jgi:drug/metabolite transporter (DMT)-like permease
MQLYLVLFIFTLLPLTLWSIIASCRPMWTIIILWMFMSEKPNWCEVTAFVGSLCGVVLVSMAAPQEGSNDFERIEEADSPILESFTTNQRYLIGVIVAVATSWLISV